MGETKQLGIARDVAFMQGSSQWPRWPLLPLRSRTLPLSDRRALAFMLADGRPRIYFGVIFMLPKGDTWEERLKTLEWKEYPTFGDVVTDYEVD